MSSAYETRVQELLKKNQEKERAFFSSHAAMLEFSFLTLMLFSEKFNFRALVFRVILAAAVFKLELRILQ